MIYMYIRALALFVEEHCSLLFKSLIIGIIIYAELFKLLVYNAPLDTIPLARRGNNAGPRRKVGCARTIGTITSESSIIFYFYLNKSHAPVCVCDV